MEQTAPISFAHLTEKELKIVRDAEKFINSQPDHQHERRGNRQIILLAYNVKAE